MGLFEERAQKTPDNTALTGAALYGFPVHEPGDGEEEDAVLLTYLDLDRATGRLAGYLGAKGVSPGVIVGIMLDRSIEMAIGIFAILKAGAAYLPIDPAYPRERIEYMLADSGAGILVTGETLFKVVGNSGSLDVEIVFMEEVFGVGAWRDLSDGQELGTEKIPATGGAAYIIYTSGSTGKPKGVMVGHNSVVNIIVALQRLYPLEESDTFLLKTSYIFDVSVAELFGWFLAGGKLAVLKKGGEKEPHKIIAAVESFAVTHINFVPSMFNVFAAELNAGNIGKLAGLKYIFLAGEALLPELVERFNRFETFIKLENIYGPTEGTVYTSNYSLSAWNGIDGIPIGKPMQNIQLYIWDKEDRLLPVGAPGELCVSGAGLAMGYLNRPELTAEKFAAELPSQARVAQRGGVGSNLLYKTGDLARWLPDGNIEFLGRIDQQVKIRGFRIELGEIENRLLKHEKITEAVVVAGEYGKTGVPLPGMDPGEKYLCAYIAGTRQRVSAGDFPTPGELREFLLQRLPEYMIPSYFVPLDNIPLSPGGKVDRKALPEPGLTMLRKEYAAPTGEIEEKLVKIWSDVLGMRDRETPAIGIDNNFFELGGHSLNATRVIARMHREFRVNFGMSELYDIPTIRGIARYIDGLETSRFTGIAAAEAKTYYSLSAAQNRLYLVHRGDPEGTGYNISALMLLEGKPEKEKFADTFKKLVERHESFRTTFKMIAGEAKQQVHDPASIEFNIEYYERGNREEETGIIRGFMRSFDLTKAPLLRVGLIERGEEAHILMVDMHHIISDGISLEIFKWEFMELYAGKELPQLKIQYKDYSQWQKSAAEKERIERQEDYWLKQFSGEVPVLDLPYDYPRPPIKSYVGSLLSFEIEGEISAALKRIALERETTLYTVLLASYYIFLAKISGRDDMVVGTPAAGRRHVDLEPVIGMFVNTLSLRNYPRRDKRFAEFLQEVKVRTLEAFENQDYQFEDLVDKLKIKRNISRNPLFDVLFSLQNKEAAEIRIPGLTLTPLEYENKTSKFDLVLMGFEMENRLIFLMEYSTKLFKEDTIGRFIGYFKDIIGIVSADIDIKLADIDISLGFTAPESEISQEYKGDFLF
jgi:amino acid adenylation domain-containing protein